MYLTELWVTFIVILEPWDWRGRVDCKVALQLVLVCIYLTVILEIEKCGVVRGDLKFFLWEENEWKMKHLGQNGHQRQKGQIVHFVFEKECQWRAYFGVCKYVQRNVRLPHMISPHQICIFRFHVKRLLRYVSYLSNWRYLVLYVYCARYRAFLSTVHVPFFVPFFVAPSLVCSTFY